MLLRFGLWPQMPGVKPGMTSIRLARVLRAENR
jgi:hypothetical protein